MEVIFHNLHVSMSTLLRGSWDEIEKLLTSKAHATTTTAEESRLMVSTLRTELKGFLSWQDWGLLSLVDFHTLFQTSSRSLSTSSANCSITFKGEVSSPRSIFLRKMSIQYSLGPRLKFSLTGLGSIFSTTYDPAVYFSGIKPNLDEH